MRCQVRLDWIVPSRDGDGRMLMKEELEEAVWMSMEIQLAGRYGVEHTSALPNSSATWGCCRFLAAAAVADLLPLLRT